MNDIRSFSQLQQYDRCAWGYKLARIDKVPERYAAWLAMGSAVHEAIEAFEKGTGDDPEEVFAKSYSRYINEATEKSRFATWFNSGPYNGYDDTNRRFSKGLDQLRGYIEYRGKHLEDKIWTTPDDELAVELPFVAEFGGVPVRGFIDQILEVEYQGRTELMVTDAKTGLQPGGEFQLALYAQAMNQKHGTDIRYGMYWMGAKGKPTKPYDLTEWTPEAIGVEFKRLDDGVKAEQFPPNPGENCRRCPVAEHCRFFQP